LIFLYSLFRLYLFTGLFRGGFGRGKPKKQFVCRLYLPLIFISFNIFALKTDLSARLYFLLYFFSFLIQKKKHILYWHDDIRVPPLKKSQYDTLCERFFSSVCTQMTLYAFFS